MNKLNWFNETYLRKSVDSNEQIGALIEQLKILSINKFGNNSNVNKKLLEEEYLTKVLKTIKVNISNSYYNLINNLNILGKNNYIERNC